MIDLIITAKVKFIKRKNPGHSPSQPKSVDPFIDPKTAVAFPPLYSHGHTLEKKLEGPLFPSCLPVMFCFVFCVILDCYFLFYVTTLLGSLQSSLVAKWSITSIIMT